MLVTLSLLAQGRAATLYVWPQSPNPSVPYTNWSRAAHSIQEAVDATQSGDIVVVTNGLYAIGGRIVHGTLTNRLVVTKAVTVRSVNGPSVTRIEGAPSSPGFPFPAFAVGDSAIRCVYLASNAVLSGFTLTNGWTRYLEVSDLDEADIETIEQVTGGGVWCQPGALVTNCVIIGNGSGSAGGGAYQGRLFNCQLLDNGTLGDGGGALSADLFSCIVRHNVTCGDGGGVVGGTLYNCLIVGNYTEGTGGGVIGSTLYQCTIAHNSVDNGRVGGALWCVLYNCICYYNDEENYGSSTLDYTCTTPMPTAGLGNITNEPAFVDRLAGNFHLLPGSPCMDAGGSVAALPSADLEGNPRPLDGNSDGTAAFEMGAYEYFPPRLLFISRSANRVALLWIGKPGVVLQRALSLFSPSWSDVPGSAGQSRMELPIGTGNEFFRLFQR
jgi:hypothetical protein